MRARSILVAIQQIVKRRPRAPLDPFFTLAPDPFFIATLDGRFQRVNPAALATLGHPEHALLATNILALLHPEDQAAAAAAIAGLAHGHPSAGLESRFACADGSYKWLVWNCTPSPNRNLAYIAARDATRRKLDHQALLASEARSACALENTTDAFFAVDAAWRLIRVNRQAERFWMLPRADVLGRNLWDVFQEAAGGPFHRLYEQAVRTGAPAHLEEFYPHPPHDRWLEVHAYPSPDGLAVYFRDVTAQHDAHDKIKRTLQEKEVLLREVHHRVKNNLQVICSMLRLQERNLRDETLLQTLRECRERVIAMAMLHDQLHRAKDFSNINLGEYIRNLTASLFSSYGVNSSAVGLRLDVEDIPVAVDNAIPCGLIVNELVSNSLRHAFPEGRKGHITLRLHALPGGLLELSVGDDGRGFAESAHPADTRSLGLWLVDLLSEQIGAAVERSTTAGAQYRFVFQTSNGDSK